MSALTFSFENSSVRTLGTPEAPLFVATDICKALSHSNPRKAIADLVDPEDIVKAEITDSMGRTQTVNCVTESGLYALIFGSKLESAKRFKRWVTSEVLPAIRKQGYYAGPDYIDEAQQREIQKAVGRRAMTFMHGSPVIGYVVDDEECGRVIWREPKTETNLPITGPVLCLLASPDEEPWAWRKTNS